MFSITNETFHSSVRSNGQPGPRLRATQLSIQRTPGIKRPGREAEHTSLQGAKEKKDWSYASASPWSIQVQFKSALLHSDFRVSIIMDVSIPSVCHITVVEYSRHTNVLACFKKCGDSLDCIVK